MTLRMESHDSTNDSKVILFFRKTQEIQGVLGGDDLKTGRSELRGLRKRKNGIFLL